MDVLSPSQVFYVNTRRSQMYLLDACLAGYKMQQQIKWKTIQTVNLSSHTLHILSGGLNLHLSYNLNKGPMLFTEQLLPVTAKDPLIHCW